MTVRSHASNHPDERKNAALAARGGGSSRPIPAFRASIYRIDVGFVFGSVARGTESQGSDVDLMIVGSAKFGEVVDALHPAQQRLSRVINPKLFTPREWCHRLQGRDPFLREVVASKKLFLVGGEDDLEELGRHQS